MAKIGILSMQRIVNYGSFLQAYGLKMILEDLGHEVEFVDYHIEKPLIEAVNSDKGGLAKKVQKGIEALKYDVPLKHRIKFILYKKNFASKYHSILGIMQRMNYNPQVDALIIGSDEVFNCIQQNPNVGYSLELFGKNNNSKRLISYAASFGNTTIEKLKKYGKYKEISDLLERFDAVSVRDKNSGYIVEKLTKRKPQIHLDPVLVYDYIGKCKQILRKDTKEKYLILYAYSGRISDSEVDYLSKYAKKRGLKIYAIGGVQKYVDEFIVGSPFEVLSYFLNAEAVVTDTFHGSIFSIIAKRPFATIMRKSLGNSYGNEEKLSDLLARLHLKDHIARNVNEIEDILNININYDYVEQIIKEEQKKAYSYLKEEISLCTQS